ncbi:hypothetical protein DUI87_04348 [Hirundo rustica rustica]|uniref:C2H2-type domain-containing protein n=1 Tax=Hirundo rustica rustica TaxID=333673 RepID=A0A3M0KYT6_HIRRU|nr:hypothetical protein DUI87_04348 [Hirundo rustica rustica]
MGGVVGPEQGWVAICQEKGQYSLGNKSLAEIALRYLWVGTGQKSLCICIRPCSDKLLRINAYRQLFLKQTCLELERYLQTEPRKISETFGEDLDCFLHASSAPDAEDNIRRLDPILLPVETSTCDKSANMDIILSRDKLLSETCLSSQSTSSSTEGYTAVNQAQLNAVTSLTPPSSPELSRHLVKTPQTLSAVDGTVTLKLVAKKTSLSSVKVGVATATAGTIKSGQSDSEQGGTGTEASPENKKRVHRCQFNGCRKVYTKSSHLKAHQRTHTDVTPIFVLKLEVMGLTQLFLKLVSNMTR